MKSTLCFSLILVLAIAGESSSAIIHVPGDQPTIQAGIDAAMNDDTVLVADGTYKGLGNKNLDFKGKAITVKSENGPKNCIIDCEGDGRGFYFYSDETEKSVVSGLTITNGTPSDGYGGGIYCEYSSPTIENNIITGNSANKSGGGIYCEGASPAIQNNIISRNSAVGSYFGGGGIDCYYSSPTIQNNEISGNLTDSDGGGIQCIYSSPTIISNIINENLASTGGGIYCYKSSPTIINNTINRNSANHQGGGIYCDYQSSPTINNNEITGNSAKECGGGILCHTSSSTIQNNWISENLASYGGGGIDCYYSPLKIMGNVISRNLVSHEGCGISCYESSPTIVNNTISGNSVSDNGGGIHCYSGSSPTVLNTILWANSPNEIYLDESSIAITYSDIQGGWKGEGNTHANPLFVNPYNGDYHLQGDSPCIDAGDPNSPKDPDGTRTDMGAFYFDQSSNPPVATILEKVSGDNQVGLISTKLLEPLVVRVRDQNGRPMFGVQVDFAVTQGDGSVNPTQAKTGADGEASTFLTLGQTAGLNQVTVAVDSLSVTFSAMGTEELLVATTLEEVSGDNQSGLIGTKLPGPLVVLVKDQYGNPMLWAQVNFAVTIGDGSVNPTQAKTDANGKVSTFLTLGQTAGLNEVTAIVNSLSVKFNAIGYYGVIYIDNDNNTGIEDGSQEHPFNTIQEGIDASVDGDTVLVADGTYKGNGNKNLDFKGKAITVISKNGPKNCIIDCEGKGRGFYFHSGETEKSVVSRFKIVSGSPGDGYGGGILCDNYSSPAIENNIIAGNSADYGGGISCNNYSFPMIRNNEISGNSAKKSGGGIYCYIYSSPTIQSNKVSGNSATSYDGGGIYCFYSSPTIQNNEINENSANNSGGGISCGKSSPTIQNNKIVGNSAGNHGGGIYSYSSSSPMIVNNTVSRNSAKNAGSGISCFSSSSPTVLNTTLWADRPSEIYVDASSMINITYSNIQGGWSGMGNINVDPLFVDAANGDYHLSNYSSCIGAGIMTSDVPDTDIEGNPRPNPPGSNPDIGAYEHLRDIPLVVTFGDVSGNGTVTAYDAALVLQYVVGTKELSSAQRKAADVTGDDNVSALDAALILQYSVGLITRFPVEIKTAAPVLTTKSERDALMKAIARLEATVLNMEQKQVLEQLKNLVFKKSPPKHTALLQNFPNPFNPDTWLPYQLSRDATVTISIYNANGQLVRVIALGNKEAGVYITKDKAIYWDGTNNIGEKVASGVYFYQLRAGNFVAIRRMVIVK
jgi:parallel beta-helix repeat protein